MTSSALVTPRYRDKFARGRPTVVYMFLPETESPCNSRCTGCYVLASESFGRRVRRSGETVISDVQTLTAAGYPVLLSTTEILMSQRYLEILRAAQSSSIMSNGKIIVANPDVVGELKGIGIRQIALTANFENGGIRLTEPRFFTEAARIVKVAGMELMLRITLTKQNLPEISEMVAACVALGADIIQFLRFIPFERGPTTIDESDAARFFGLLDELRVRYPTIYISAGGSLGSQFRKKEKQAACPAGKTQFVIGLDNGIYPCIYLTQRENRLGEFVDRELRVESEFSLAVACGSGIGNEVNPLECPAYAYLKEKSIRCFI